MGGPSIAVREKWGAPWFSKVDPLSRETRPPLFILDDGGKRILAGNILPDETRGKVHHH